MHSRVTIRLRYRLRRTNFIPTQDHGIANVKAYNKDTTVMNWTSNKDGVSRGELFDLATYAPGEIVKEIYVR